MYPSHNNPAPQTFAAFRPKASAAPTAVSLRRISCPRMVNYFAGQEKRGRLQAQAFPEVVQYLIHGRTRVNVKQEAPVTVKADKGSRLGAVDFKAFGDGFRPVVVAGIDFAAAVVAYSFPPGPVEHHMEVMAAFPAGPPAAEPFQNGLVGDVEVDDPVHGGKSGEGFGLGNRPGEAVENVAAERVFSGKPFPYQGRGGFVVHELPRVKDILDLEAKRRSRGDSRPENVPRTNVGNFKKVYRPGGKRALSRSGRAKKNKFHCFYGIIFARFFKAGERLFTPVTKPGEQSLPAR